MEYKWKWVLAMSPLVMTWGPMGAMASGGIAPGPLVIKPPF
jgi:hypothetical protein